MATMPLGYAVAMAVHMLGLVAVFGGFVLQHRVGARLRAARRFDEARGWAELLDTTRPMVPSGAVMLFLSGGWLTSVLHPDVPGWVAVAAAGVVFVGIAGWVSGVRFARAKKAVASGEGPLSAEARAAIGAWAGWVALAAANGVALGMIWLMTARPTTLAAAGMVVVPAVIGAAIGLRLGRP